MAHHKRGVSERRPSDPAHTRSPQRPSPPIPNRTLTFPTLPPQVPAMTATFSPPSPASRVKPKPKHPRRAHQNDFARRSRPKIQTSTIHQRGPPPSPKPNRGPSRHRRHPRNPPRLPLTSRRAKRPRSPSKSTSSRTKPIRRRRIGSSCTTCSPSSAARSSRPSIRWDARRTGGRTDVPMRGATPSRPRSRLSANGSRRSSRSCCPRRPRIRLRPRPSTICSGRCRTASVCSRCSMRTMRRSRRALPRSASGGARRAISSRPRASSRVILTAMCRALWTSCAACLASGPRWRFWH